MEMVRMITISGHVYAGRQLKNGDEFDCEAVHVSVMQILGRARRKDEALADEQKYRTRDMTTRRSRVKS
jgi:hypothetical protein